MDRTTQCAEQHGRAQAKPAGVGHCVGEERDGLEARHSAHDLLHDPRAVKAERFRAPEEITEARGLDASGDERLRNRDGQLEARAHRAEGTIR